MSKSSSSRSFPVIAFASMVSFVAVATTLLRPMRCVGCKEEDVEVHSQKTERNLKILSAATDLLSGPWGFQNRHVASALAQIRPSPFWGTWGKLVNRRVEILITPAGFDIEVEFIEPIDLPSPPPSSIPIIIILHGINGNSTEPYVEQAALHIAVQRRWRAVVLNYGKLSLTKNKSSSLGGTSLIDGGDLNFLVSHIRKEHNGFLAAIGYSMGGAKLVQYLVRTCEHCNLDAACTISSPLDFTTRNDTVHKPKTQLMYRYYHFMVTSGLKFWMLRNYKELKKHPRISKSRPFRRTASGLLWWLHANTVPDVDSAITIYAKGYSDLNQYYKDATRIDRLQDSIKIPFLCITAKNDPFVPVKIIPTPDIAMANENIFIVNTPRLGGHIGYWLPGLGCWATKGCLSFFGSVKKYAPTKTKNRLLRRETSLQAAHNLQRSSCTGLTNYFKLVAND